MSNTNLKTSLLSSQRPLVERLTVGADSGPVELVTRRPPTRVVMELLGGAEEAGIRDGNMHNVKSTEALMFNARVIAETLYEPNGIRPLFTVEEVLDWTLAGEVTAACMRAIIPAGAAVESAKGN